MRVNKTIGVCACLLNDRKNVAGMHAGVGTGMEGVIDVPVKDSSVCASSVRYLVAAHTPVDAGGTHSTRRDSKPSKTPNGRASTSLNRMLLLKPIGTSAVGRQWIDHDTRGVTGRGWCPPPIARTIIASRMCATLVLSELANDTFLRRILSRLLRGVLLGDTEGKQIYYIRYHILGMEVTVS